MIEVVHHHAEPELSFARNPGLLRHVCESAVAVVAVQLVIAVGIVLPDAGGMDFQLTALEVARRVAEQEEIEVAVAVVVKKDRVGGEAGVRDMVLRRGLGEGAVAIVDEQQVLALRGRRPRRPRHRDVDIEIPVVVDIDHTDAACPPACRDPRRLGDVCEPHVALVQVEATRNHVAREEDVRQAVVIDVADRNTPAVVNVRIRQHVDGIGDRDGVGEGDVGVPRAQTLKEGTGARARTTAAHHTHRRQHGALHGAMVRVLYSAT